MSDRLDYKTSSGNIFKDLDLPNSEERLAKAKLAAKIVDLTKHKGLTQKQIAVVLGIDQPKISDLYRGRLSGFSIPRLIKFLNFLEQDVEILIKDKANRTEHHGHLSVISDEPIQISK